LLGISFRFFLVKEFICFFLHFGHHFILPLFDGFFFVALSFFFALFIGVFVTIDLLRGLVS